MQEKQEEFAARPVRPEPLRLKFGKIKELSEKFGVSRNTIAQALRYERDTDRQEAIRQYAIAHGFVRKF